jgi:hypothetical protein
MADIPIACSCGKVTGRLVDCGPQDGTHTLCFCDSCRAGHLALGQPDPKDTGVGLFNTTPDKVVIDTGAEHLAALYIKNPKTLRWYAACCSAPLAITGPGPGLPFASIQTDRAADPAAFGPVRVRAFLRGKDGKQRHEHLLRFVIGMIRRSGAARMTGCWRQTPFFTMPAGTPVAPPRPLSGEERTRAGL